MKIGRLYIGVRAYGRDKFRWFYHPMLRKHEEESFVFFVWIGWHIACCLAKKKNNKGRN